MKRFHLLGGLALGAIVALSGCNSTSDTPAETLTGYFVDSAVKNVDYDCVADGVYDKVTGPNGEFSCSSMAQVRFRLGNITLGEINALPADGYVTPQDIAGVNRTDLNDSRVLAIATLLQSLDSDGNVTNGIEISDSAKEVLAQSGTDVESIDTILSLLEAANVRINTRTQAEVQQHLHATLQTLHAGNTMQNGLGGAGGQHGNSGTNGQQGQGGGQGGGFAIDNYPVSASLSDRLIETIAYMGNEERLAYDLYLALYNLHDQNQSLTPLYNIATRSEIKHIEAVQAIVKRYEAKGVLDTAAIQGLVPVADSSASIDQMPEGQYGITAVQDLYDTLYAHGSQSVQAALEAGCMVEVTDVNDLNADIDLAQKEGAVDIVAAYEFLRQGSYYHYWAFDKALKNMGVTEGCCSLGEEWCHPEYPTNPNGGNH